MILLSHPTGNQHARQAALAFSEVGALSRFTTAIQLNSRGLLARSLPSESPTNLAAGIFPTSSTRR